MAAALPRSLKTRITTATALFPLSMAAAVGLWLSDTDYSLDSCLALGLLLAATIATRWFSNAIQLIRVRSWAVASFFVLLVALCSHTYQWSPQTMAGGWLLLIYTIGLLLSHQSKAPQVPVLAASAALSLLSMIMPQLAWLLPIFLLSLLTPLRSLTPRSLLAMLFGLLLPYMAFVGWHACQGTALTVLQETGDSLLCFSLPRLADLVPVDGLSATAASLSAPNIYRLGMTLMGLLGVVHFIHTRYNDKVSTRTFYIAIIMHWPAVAALQFFTTGHDALVAALTALFNSILLSHYFVFSKGWIANALFWLFVLLCCYLTYPVC